MTNHCHFKVPTATVREPLVVVCAAGCREISLCTVLLTGTLHVHFFCSTGEHYFVCICSFNRIDIPPYETFEKFVDKLTCAVEETCGFAVEWVIADMAIEERVGNFEDQCYVTCSSLLIDVTLGSLAILQQAISSERLKQLKWVTKVFLACYLAWLPFISNFQQRLVVRGERHQKVNRTEEFYCCPHVSSFVSQV